MSPKKIQNLIGYLRQSRSHEDSISEDLQKQTIENWAALHGHIVTFLSIDSNKSGKNLKRPSMQEALGLLAAGKYDGIVAAKLDRFSRNVGDLGTLIKLAESQRWNLIAIDLGVDTSTSNGKMIAQMLGVLAEWELDRRREGWKETRANAVDRGVHVAKIPFGYERGEDGALVPDENGPLVTELFARRARGETYDSLAKWLTDEGATKRYSDTPWQVQDVSKILLGNNGRSSDVYLGHLREYEIIRDEGTNKVVDRVLRNEKLNAHPALTDEETFWRVQAGVTKKKASEGKGHPLMGVVKCAACGGTISKSWTDSEHRHSTYRCRNRACTNQASVSGEVLEPFVFWAVAERATYIVNEPSEANAALDAAREVEAEAVAARDTFDLTWEQRGVDPVDAAVIRGTLTRKIEDARKAVTEIPLVATDWRSAVRKAAEEWNTFFKGDVLDPEQGVREVEATFTDGIPAWAIRELLELASGPNTQSELLETARDIVLQTVKKIEVVGKSATVKSRKQETPEQVAARVIVEEA